MAGYIESLTVQNFGCVKQAELKLTPLHALIGPNDSGKSTLLAALRSVLTAPRSGEVDPRVWPHARLEAKAGLTALSVATNGGLRVHLTHQGRSTAERQGNDPLWLSTVLKNLNVPTGSFGRGARFVRLSPRRLREASPLVPHEQVVHFDEDVALAGVVDAIATRDVDAFVALREDVRRLFPTVKNLALKNVNNFTKELSITLTDDTVVSPNSISDGLLYYVAFRILGNLDPVSAILIEEPENGLHPSRIADVMRVLRELSAEQLVVISTHSPLVINELKPEEVSVVTRTLKEGTKITPIASTPNFAERSKVYALGELWLSYANGTDEGPLLNATDKPQSAAE